MLLFACFLLFYFEMESYCVAPAGLVLSEKPRLRSDLRQSSHLSLSAGMAGASHHTPGSLITGTLKPSALPNASERGKEQLAV